MSTKVVGAYSDELDSLSSLEYLVSPLQQAPTSVHKSGLNRPEMRTKSDFNNSLQKLTNLVYLLARETTAEEDKHTALVLLQSEVAHLSVLARRAGMTRAEGEKEMEVTQ